MKQPIFLALLPTTDSTMMLSQKISLCEAKRSPVINIDWVDPRDQHITLGFLADVDISDIPLIASSFSSLSEQSSFISQIEEVRFYGNALVLILEPVTLFTKLHRKMNEQLLSKTHERYRFNESTRFTPHLTLGRVRNISKVNMTHKQQLIHMLIDQCQNTHLTIQQGALLHRTSQTHHPVYTLLHRYRLT